MIRKSSGIRPYVNNRKKMAEEVENGFAYADQLGVIKNLSPRVGRCFKGSLYATQTFRIW